MSNKNLLTRIISFTICFLLLFEQSGFAQIAGQLDISLRLASLQQGLTQEKFRPLHLRYLSYDNIANNFKLLLDKGDLKNPQTKELENATKQLLNYFFVGVSLPNDSFWVNLRPDSPDNIIDPELAKTDIGKVLLEADLQLKKDTAQYTNPQTLEGKTYWTKLYQKAEELFGYEAVTIPTLTRPWIVPGEIIIRETQDNAYIYKASLKVMLEQDYLKDSTTYKFDDPRLKVLNEYSSRLIRELIIPKITKEVNTSKKYAPLRQVYYSLILAQWFKSKYYGRGGLYSWLINKKNLNGLTAKTPYSKDTYFKAYQDSFNKGEYSLKEPQATPFGQTIRSYFSGGISVGPEVTAAMAQGAVQSKRKLLVQQWGEKNFAVSINFSAAKEVSNIGEGTLTVEPLREVGLPAGAPSAVAPRLGEGTLAQYLDNIDASAKPVHVQARKKTQEIISRAARGGKQVILEFGCGPARTAYALAQANPGTGIIATDVFRPRKPNLLVYDPYAKYTQGWESGELPAQTEPLLSDNLAVVRAEADILRYVPDNCLDYILLVNPAFQALKELFALREELVRKLKTGGKIIIKPVGDFKDCLPYIGDGFTFQEAESVFLSVDLDRVSDFPSRRKPQVWINEKAQENKPDNGISLSPQSPSAAAPTVVYAQAMQLSTQNPSCGDSAIKDGLKVHIENPEQAKEFGEKLIAQGRATKKQIKYGSGSPVRVRGEPLQVIIENGIGLSEAELFSLLCQAKYTGLDWDNLPTTLVIVSLDASRHMAEDHLANGFIGINRAWNDFEDGVKDIVLKVALVHEFSHEFSGQSGEAFEAEQFERDVAYTHKLLMTSGAVNAASFIRTVKGKFADDAFFNAVCVAHFSNNFSLDSFWEESLTRIYASRIRFFALGAEHPSVVIDSKYRSIVVNSDALVESMQRDREYEIFDLIIQAAIQSDKLRGSGFYAKEKIWIGNVDAAFLLRIAPWLHDRLLYRSLGRHRKLFAGA
ncbi:MAG: class I SAM-dependent methyltransferase, partial [Candidatus Omnitrophica bacterium]|nr:class I SAM-dependent methyltransferase [Candidatus Omnitrophota bacterium]